MSDLKEEIARLIQTAEEAAYQRGWDDALGPVDTYRIHRMMAASVITA
jgi:hypothetical protein